MIFLGQMMRGGRKEGGRKEGVRDNRRKILEGLTNFFRETFPVFFVQCLNAAHAIYTNTLSVFK